MSVGSPSAYSGQASRPPSSILPQFHLSDRFTFNFPAGRALVQFNVISVRITKVVIFFEIFWYRGVGHQVPLSVLLSFFLQGQFLHDNLPTHLAVNNQYMRLTRLDPVINLQYPVGFLLGSLRYAIPTLKIKSSN